MMVDRVAVVGAVLSLLLQVLLAPHIVIGCAVPNFMAAFCLALAVSRPSAGGPVLAFLMGLLYDLLSGGPVGGMAFSLTLAAALASSMFRRANNDTLFMAIAVLAGSVFALEFVYGSLFLLFGYATSFSEALVYRMLPCFLYDFVIALAFFFVSTRFAGQSTPMSSEIKQL